MERNEAFKRLREERGVSQRKLTKGICARSTLSTFENKGSQLSIDLCSRLLDRLNIRMDTYFSMFLEDFDNKRAEFSQFKENIVSENIEELPKKKVKYLRLYESTHDFYWFNLYLHCSRIISQLTEDFTYERFNRTHKHDIDRVKNYLYNINSWGPFEFAVFSNSIWCFDFEFIKLVKRKLEKNYATSSEYKKYLYGSFLLNLGFFCLEYGHFEWIKQLKKELFAFSSYDNIHWKIMVSFQLSISEELTNQHSALNEEITSSIEIYQKMEEEHYYDNMIKYRERIINKHKKT
ncbi:Rgg/GadR/MutR family transcriptional regulator [Alkalibacterium olivapovliticus]|uniref:Helix-turn-helix protein n=1 Tax=Alkalibacterium olivapovliticus TaxID=99907 RepID=A0A2T0VQ79_9LACT|nr:Rgg/GadR/MutR family transcriptional regulator [Alkalibacterium olivapovliticus]PRY72521.1 helix-turn-helix protein [Alkalibacterium olivapovliticus]